MDGIILLVFAALVQGPPLSPTTQPIDFYFTNDAVLERGTAALAQWTAQCVAGGEFARVAASYAPDTRMSADARKAQAAKFDRREFERLATDAWRRANAALPQGPLRVCIDLAADTDVFTRDVMGGIAGATAGHGRIILRIHADANWQAALPYALAHEMHHSYWAQHHFAPKKPFTLADYMVFEGRADYFAGTLFTHRAPWTAALDATAYDTAWRTLSQQLTATESGALQTAMFGSPQAGIPAWAGYTIGYRLVSERMARAPRLDLTAMTSAPASEFIPASSPK
jgi:hypothetical protein